MKSIWIAIASLYAVSHSPKAPPAPAAEVRRADPGAKGPSEAYRAQMARELARQKAKRAAKASAYQAQMKAEAEADRRRRGAAMLRDLSPADRNTIRRAEGTAPR